MSRDLLAAAEEDVKAILAEMDQASQAVYAAQTPRHKEIAEKKYIELAAAKEKAIAHVSAVIAAIQNGIDLERRQKEHRRLSSFVPPVEEALREYTVAEAIMLEKKTAAEAHWAVYQREAREYLGSLLPLQVGEEPPPGQLPRSIDLLLREVKKRDGAKLPSLMNHVKVMGVPWDEHQALQEAYAERDRAQHDAREQVYRQHTGVLTSQERERLVYLLDQTGQAIENGVGLADALGLDEQVTRDQIREIARTGTHPSIDIAAISMNLEPAIKLAELRIYGSPQMHAIAEDHVAQGYPALSNRIVVTE